MSASLAGHAVIAGIGATAFGKLPGRDLLSLNVEACRKALHDAGVAKERVDAVFVKVPTSQREFMFGQRVAEALGLQPRVGGAWDQGGAAAISLISMAIGSILAGQCKVALICYADNPRTGNPKAFSRPGGADAVYGWFSTAAGYAMIQQRYQAEFKVPPEAFAEVAIAARRHGAANPHAQLRSPLGMEAYFSGRPIVEPLRRDDCALVSDGGAALVVMAASTARQLQVKAPVPILGIGQCQTSWDVHLRPALTQTCADVSARMAFEMAGLRPADIDVAQLYDCFTITALMTLEDYGFCKKGQAAAFVRGGQLQFGGQLPMNTSGGLLSETGMPGLQLIMEGVRQMRGSAQLQVAGARHCIVSNQGGVMHTHSTLILGQ